ncbi:MAG: carboxypeptidase regulatory-like domain-containing protein, partial [Calditrichaeota bacterium]|nr:carboxypeptidase regulatory-like domain-containing protein [Calditrichota bacterium]
MRSLNIANSLRVAGILFLWVFLCLPLPSSAADFSLNPHGIAAGLDADEQTAVDMLLSNSTDEAAAFRIKTVRPPRGQQGGPQRDDPRRDDPNTLRVLLVKTQDDRAYGWHDRDSWLAVFQNQDPQPRQIDIQGIGNVNLADFDLVATGEDQNASFFQEFNNRRAVFEEYVDGGGVFSIFAGSNSFQDIRLFKEGGQIAVSRGPGGDWGNVNPDFLNQQRNGLRAGIEDELPLLTPFEFFRDDNQDTNRVRRIMRGNSLNYAVVPIADVPRDGVWYYRPQQQDNTAIIAEWPFGSGWVLFTGITGTLFYEQNWQWSSMMECVNLTRWAEARSVPQWALFDPAEGEIEANGELDIEVTIDPEGLEEGVHYLRAQLMIGQQQQPAVDIPLLLSVEDDVGGIVGVITDAATDQPIEGAQITIDPSLYVFIRYSDREGRWALPNLPPGNYPLTCEKADYQVFNVARLDIRAGEDADGSIAMLHSTCEPDVDELFTQLEPGGETDMDFTIANNGNGPLAYRVERRLLGEANAAPWELRRNYAVGNLLNDDRIEGVAFDGDNFFLSGAAGQNPNAIYVVNREGERVRQFVQPGESNYGMKDLEWDGELLWGSGEQRVFGFDREGQL